MTKRRGRWQRHFRSRHPTTARAFPLALEAFALKTPFQPVSSRIARIVIALVLRCQKGYSFPVKYDGTLVERGSKAASLKVPQVPPR